MRNLLQVIDAMALQIPDCESALLADLATIARDNRYRAPECQDWHRTAGVLNLHLEKLTAGDVWCEEWCGPVLKIWRDEA